MWLYFSHLSRDKRRVRWLPLETLRFCLSHAECKLIILDSERADRLESAVSGLRGCFPTVAFLVLDSYEGKGVWEGMQCFRTVVAQYNPTSGDLLIREPDIWPEDNAAIMFTSGA